MVSLATKVVAISAAAMLAQYYASSSLTLGTSLNAAAMQQGGVGLIMSVLMVMAPPMAAMFFGGTLGNFIANSSFGNVGRNTTGQTTDNVQQIQGTGGRRPNDDTRGAGGSSTAPSGTFTPNHGNRAPNSN